jgi:hypothetical protein
MQLGGPTAAEATRPHPVTQCARLREVVEEGGATAQPVALRALGRHGLGIPRRTFLQRDKVLTSLGVAELLGSAGAEHLERPCAPT